MSRIIKRLSLTALVLPSILGLASCGGGDSKSLPSSVSVGKVSPPQSCDIPSQQKFVVDVMKDTYLWYDQVPEIDIENYDTVDDTLAALRVHPDRFSYVTTLEETTSFFEEGTYEGFGMRIAAHASGEAYVIGLVFNDSSAGRAEWKRSDRITSVNGTSAVDLINGEGIHALLAGFDTGDSVSFTRVTQEGVESQHVLTKGLVRMNTVISPQVVETESQTVGYLGISAFIENTSTEFANAIKQLGSENISELVLDLRYNTGGRVEASRDVASYIGGVITEGFVYSHLSHNDKYDHDDFSYRFKAFNEALSLNRVYILTTEATCSASELLINGLSPFIDVVQIGGTSCGKPIGMYSKPFCDQVLFPIEFQLSNHLNQGDYFEGLSPLCTADDDLDHDFADLNEGMFASAIHHMNNGQCQSSVKSAFSVRSRAPKVPESLNPMDQFL